MVRQLWRNQDGQDMVEYALLVALIAVAGAAAFVPVAPGIDAIYTKLLAVLGR